MDSRPIGETIAASPVVANMQSGLSNLQASASNLGSSITDTVSGIKDSVSSKLGEFSAPNNLGETGASEFASSNGLIAKFVFLILVLVVFVALLNTGIYLITQWNKPDRSPYIVKGMQDGNRAKTITQDPRNSNSKTIYRSNNASKGIEFTWSVWLNLTDMPSSNQIQTVFVKGAVSKDGAIKNGPSVYLKSDRSVPFFGSITGTTLTVSGTTRANDTPPPTLAIGQTITSGQTDYGTIDAVGASNTYTLSKTQTSAVSAQQMDATSDDSNTAKLVIKMDDSAVSQTSIPTIEIANIPIKRWFHIAIRQQNKIMDVYMNGTIAKRYTFENLPKQNYDDIHIAPNGGFIGKLSNLRYFDSALNVFQITNIAMAGPDLTNADDAKDTKFDYLSSSWYSKNA